MSLIWNPAGVFVFPKNCNANEYILLIDDVGFNMAVVHSLAPTNPVDAA